MRSLLGDCRRPHLRKLGAAAFFIGGLLASPAIAAEQHETSAGAVTVERIAGPFEHPWALAFLPEPDALLVTEREGALRVVRKGRISRPVANLPRVYNYGQGGLLDVALDPNFAETSRIFWTFAEPAGRGARTALASGRLVDWKTNRPRLEDVKMLFQQQPALNSGFHFGSRIVFKGDNTLFITTGDRGRANLVQKLDNHVGKVIRLTLDGEIPADNPFIDQPGALPEIWSLGHRNPQGAARRPADGAYYTIAHGAAGGDEVNRPEAGRNYGWPTISYGTHYSGRKIGVGTRAPGLEQPLFYWDPSIAPSGAVFYEGDMFPEWKGHLLVGSLKFRLISRLSFDDGKLAERERMLTRAYGRVRDVRVAADGAVWFAIDDAEGAVYRMSRAQ